MASCATYNAVCRSGVNFDIDTLPATLWSMLTTGFGASAPAGAKYAIFDRVMDYAAAVLANNPANPPHFSENPLHWGWENTLDLSNAIGTAQAGQYGFDINLAAGFIEGIEHSNEDFETFFRIENLTGSDLGDIITLDSGTTYIEIHAGSGDDVVYADGNTVVAWGGGGEDEFFVNASSTEVDFLRTFDRVTILNSGASFTYGLEDFDWVHFTDVTVSFEDLLENIEQIINGTPGVDILDGTDRKDLVKGFASNDSINGNGGDDRIYGGAGNDTINGGSGTDKAFYSGNIADYGIGIVGDKVVLTDTVANRDGVDTLAGIEELFFEDGSIIVANLPKAPTSFQVLHANVHTHIGMVTGGQFYAAGLTNIVDPDGGTNRMEIDTSRTDGAILPYLVINSYGKLTFNGIAPSGTFDIGLRTYDAANNVRSETQVVSLEVQENTAPIGVSWNSNPIHATTTGTIAENSAANTIVGNLVISDPDGQLGGGSGENYSIRLVGQYSSTYAVTDEGDYILGNHEHYHHVKVIDPGNVDYERDPTPDLTVEITDIAGNVRTFTLQLNLQNTTGTTWNATAGTAAQVRSYNGGAGDDTLNASASLGKYTIYGGAGGDTIYGGAKGDEIDGGPGNDVMRGNGGNDLIRSHEGSDTIYGGNDFDTVNLSSLYRPEQVDNVYMSGGFLVIAHEDTVVKIYQDVEQITIGPIFGNTSAWTLGGYLAEYQLSH